jgi:hypothetical protein
VIRTATAIVWFYAGADRYRRAVHLDDLTPAAALTIMAESLSEGGLDRRIARRLNDPRWAEAVMGGLSAPRRTLWPASRRFAGMGHGWVFGVVSVPDVRELAAGSRPRLAA